MEEALA